jgi:hypothetical protein
VGQLVNRLCDRFGVLEAVPAYPTKRVIGATWAGNSTQPGAGSGNPRGVSDGFLWRDARGRGRNASQWTSRTQPETQFAPAAPPRVVSRLIDDDLLDSRRRTVWRATVRWGTVALATVRRRTISTAIGWTAGWWTARVGIARVANEGVALRDVSIVGRIACELRRDGALHSLAILLSGELPGVGWRATIDTDFRTVRALMAPFAAASTTATSTEQLGQTAAPSSTSSAIAAITAAASAATAEELPEIETLGECRA